MSGHYIRKRTRAGQWAWSLATFSAVLIVVTVLFLRLGVLDLSGFSLGMIAVAALVVLALALASVAIAKAWFQGYRGGGRAVAGLAVALLVSLPFALGIALAIENPIATEAETEGLALESDAAGAGRASRPLLGREFRATAAEVYGAARSTIEASGWDIVDVRVAEPPLAAEGDLGVSGTVLVPVPTLRETLSDSVADVDPFAATDSDEYTIAAVAYAPVLGFASDVTVRIAEIDGTSLVDLRSASRDLPRDLGQNRRFIEGFLTRLDAAMDLLQSGPVED